MGKTNSQEQCASSDSAHDESYGNHCHDMKGAALFMTNPEVSNNGSQGEITQPIFPSQLQFPFGYSDPFHGGLYAAYGPPTMIQPQVMNPAAPGRVPLPVDIPEDGPIYVNAKQYHGILRRRQTRAKLEAQNKLVKTRKPYLHESRHQHALNRVRGSGGRFLSTKKQQQHDSLPPSNSQGTASGFNAKLNLMNSSAREMEANNFISPRIPDGIPVSAAEAILQVQQPDGRFSGMPPHMAVPMQGNGGAGGLGYNGNRRYASIVR